MLWDRKGRDVSYDAPVVKAHQFPQHFEFNAVGKTHQSHPVEIDEETALITWPFPNQTVLDAYSLITKDKSCPLGTSHPNP